MSFKHALVWLCFISASTVAATADPGDAIGSAVTVVNRVTGEFRQDVRRLTSGDDVLSEEVIAAGVDAIGELLLRDQTKVAIGPGARLTLDRFVYDPNKSGGAIVLNLIKGSFRFITGIAAKPVYVIRTPVAAITVRGTIFDVYVEEGGAIWLLLHEGSIHACNTRDQCQTLEDPCRLLRIGADGDLQRDPGTWNALPQARGVNFAAAFPFVVDPPGFDPHPIFTRQDIELGRCPEPKVRKAERSEPPAKHKVQKARKPRQAYARRRKAYPRYSNPMPGFSISIGIGGGGGGGGHGGHGR
jgi:hypothetical protein